MNDRHRGLAPINQSTSIVACLTDGPLLTMRSVTTADRVGSAGIQPAANAVAMKC